MSALVLVVPELEAPLADIRAEHDPAARQGMPPHVTLLYPFASVTRLTEEQRARLRAVAAVFAPMELSFGRTARFPEVLWLAPEPEDQVLALSHALAAAFPAYPPYRGKFANVVPHLTIAQAREPVLTRLEAEVRRRLAEPVAARPDAIALFHAYEGRWVEVERFALG